MKILLFGKKSDQIRPLVLSAGLEIVEKNPQAVISYGGDGTLLSSEHKYPSVPKLSIRNNTICIKCFKHRDKTVLNKLKSGKLKLSKAAKLEISLEGKKILATNDFVIRNSLQMHAIRFKVYKNNKQIDGLVIGDGVVLATAFGSTGYFQSITRKSLSKGFGLAFNNTTRILKPVLFSAKDVIKITIVRGPATLTYDNNPKTNVLLGNSRIVFKPSQDKFQVFDSSINCTKCKIKRDD